MRIYEIKSNSQKLDGGAMFGNAPKALWSRWHETDEENRIELQCRCMLLDTGKERILFETGIGNFFPDKLLKRYGVQETEHVLTSSLKENGFNKEDITHIILSHLHFDHAGGLLKKDGSSHFPNAKIFVGKKNWERALNPHSRDRASFTPEIVECLKKSQLSLLEDEAPFSFIKLRYSDGHTPGLMMSSIVLKNFEIIFASDLIPGSTWVHVPITMGYDRYPELVIDEKEKLLKECAQNGHYLYFTHDPICAMSKVKKVDHKYVLDGDNNMLFGKDLLTL